MYREKFEVTVMKTGASFDIGRVRIRDAIVTYTFLV
jgi:hypothetical protein